MVECYGRSENMKNKLLFYCIAIFACLAILFSIHYLTKPEEMPVVTRNTVSGQLSYDEVNEFVYNQNNTVYLFFFSSKEADSTYVINNILNPILQENKLETFDDLYYVDLANLPADTSDKYTKNQWGFYNLPSFVGLKIENNKVQISDLLEWDGTNPYTMDTVKTWLNEHKLLTQN